MGNRASISIENCDTKIYLQWNGGMGSVGAFINEASKRYNKNSDEDLNIQDETFAFYLFAAIREYFDFAGDKKYRGRNNYSLYLSDYKNEEDNGHYHVKSCGKIDTTQARLIESKSYTNESFESIKKFYSNLELILMNADFE